MNASTYQKLATRTMNRKLSEDSALMRELGIAVIDPNRFNKGFAILIAALGLAGEAGEVLEPLKKHFGHGLEEHPLDDEELDKELGDVCWYLAALAHLRGRDLGDIMLKNLKKLEKRYPEHFSPEASANRVE